MHISEPVALLAPNRMTARDQDSAVGEEVCSGCVEATRERGRLSRRLRSATASFPLSAARDFEAERDLASRATVCHAFSRDQQTSMQHEIASVRASPRNPDRHLPASVLLAATLRMPVPGLPTEPGARLAIVERRSE
jgi:hypothetical protein